MNCVKSRHAIEDIIKKSRFIGLILPCANEHDVLQNLKQIHEEYSDASHIAYAWRLKTDQGLVYRFHDAGEPAGTAGKPIYQHLEGNDLINLLVAVIRYFGGIKLGAGGLTRAYGNTAKHVIDAAKTCPYIEWARVQLILDYPQMQLLEYQLKKLGGQIVKQDFAEQIRMTVELPAEQKDDLLKTFPCAAR